MTKQKQKQKQNTPPLLPLLAAKHNRLTVARIWPPSFFYFFFKMGPDLATVVAGKWASPAYDGQIRMQLDISFFKRHDQIWLPLAWPGHPPGRIGWGTARFGPRRSNPNATWPFFCLPDLAISQVNLVWGQPSPAHGDQIRPPHHIRLGG